MALLIPHADYDGALRYWARCRDCYEGEDAVKARGEHYLPKINASMPVDRYDAYRLRAEFFPGFARMASGFAGLVMATDPSITVADAYADELSDVVLDDTGLSMFAADVCPELWVTGRVGVLVNYSVAAKRPVWSWYTAEEIVNWTQGTLADGWKGYTAVLLRQTAREWIPEAKAYEPVEYHTSHEVIDGRWTVTRYRTTKRDEEPQMLDQPVVPLRAGSPLPYVPFIIANSVRLGPMLQKPPLVDAANGVLSMYRTSADLEYGAHYTAIPHPVITGHRLAEGDKLVIGGPHAWVIPEADAKATMLEFTGAGLGILRDILKAKRENLAAIGARFLEPSSRGAEAHSTVRLRMGAELASLNDVRNAMQSLLTAAVREHLRWQMASDAAVGDALVTLPHSFADPQIEAPELRELLAAWLQRGISFETLFAKLKRGGVIAPARSIEEEREAIDRETAADDTAELQPRPW